MIKTFRGRMADGTQEVIRLKTNDGLTGYKIVKLQLFPYKVGHTDNVESLVQVFSTKRKGAIATAAPESDFTDPTLLASAYYHDNIGEHYIDNITVIIDNKKVNQDIFITHTAGAGDDAEINYYLELEQVKLDINEATVATLKDMRGRN